jgi:transcriptional antiterminator NusG
LEQSELVEIETTEDAPVEAEEAAPEAGEIELEPEDRARQLFASILEPPVAPVEEEQDGEPADDEPTELEAGTDLDPSQVQDRMDDDTLPADESEEAGAEEGDEPEEEPVEGERNWYVIHSYSGYENKVRKNLEHRIESLGMQHKIFDVVVPTEEEIELKDGQRRTVERRIFPGYIMVEMVMDEDSWYVVRNTPGVTGFVGSIRRPTALPTRDVDRILKRMRAETPKVKVTFREGQKVRISDGPFEDFVGAVDAIFADKGKVRILVSFFGRETPVELDFLQVEKI